MPFPGFPSVVRKGQALVHDGVQWALSLIVTRSGTLTAGRLTEGTATPGAVQDSNIADAVTGNVLTIAGTLTGLRTQTARDASGNLCLDSVDNGFLVTQRFNAAEAIACGVAATAGNGLVQRVGGVTKATGDAWGTDCFLHRASAGVLLFNTTQAQADNGFIAGRSSVTSAGYDSFQNSSTWALRSQRTDGSLQWSLNTDGFGSAYFTGLANGLGVNVAPTAGNGLVQRASGTTRANGDAWGNDTFMWRDSAASLITEGAFRSNNATGGIGYATGAGGTVTQITSRTTGVTINKITGTITLVSAAGSVVWQSFTVTNSAVAATDTIICNQVSGTDLNMIHVTAIAAGSFRISFATTAGVTVEQPVFRFTVIKSVSA
jgi:hypothetical protein